MEWIDAKELPPTKEDSPILACREGGEHDEYGFLNMTVLRWRDGRDNEGWYDHSDEYGFDQKDITHWIQVRSFGWPREKKSKELPDGNRFQDMIADLCRIIREKHHQMLDEFGKAYAAELASLGKDFRIQDICLVEQEPIQNLAFLEKRYWFEHKPKKKTKDE